ncbi:MAG: thiolase C-terminal domain-containing protein [Panacagrimonas sp.]
MSAAPLPALDGPCPEFWTAGTRGELQILWCAHCARYLHPSCDLCPHCLSSELVARAIDGRATLLSFTENHQAWAQSPPAPYWIAIVALDAAPAVRLTTRLVGVEGKILRIGAPLQVRFEAHEDVWLPLFEMIDGPCADIVEPPPRVHVRPRTQTEKFEDRVAITGVGASGIGRKLPRGPAALTVDACRAALDDAGLSLTDIDGVSAYPGSSGMPGVSAGGVRALAQTLGIEPAWHCGAQELAGQTGALVEAMLALSAGLCSHVLCMSSFSEAQRPWNLSPRTRISGESAWRIPFGAMTPVNWIALYATHYLARFGVSREALGWIAITARRHAAGNPEALHRAPLDMDAYLGARMISTPFGLHDCDTPCDGAIAFVLSRREVAPDLRQPPVLIEAVGTHIAEPQFWDQGTLLHQVNVFGPAAHLWTRTDLRPRDVDLACLYDGFSFNVLSWLEALGFCGLGEAADFVAGGQRIALGGELPLNPHGGHLAAGRSNGYGHVREAVLQLRGQAAGRQVQDARLAVTSSGGGIPGGCLLLRNAQ